MQLISEETNTTCLFFHLDEGESRESMHAKFVELKENGIECFIGCPSSGEYMGWAFWTDMDIMIDELQKLGMRFFIQDEQTFPRRGQRLDSPPPPGSGKTFCRLPRD